MKTPMSFEAALRCERECTRLCHDFAWSVDQGDYPAFVSLFTEDGVFERGGQRSVGHAAIRQFLEARPAGRTTRHLCSNIRIDPVDPSTAVGTSSALMFAASVGSGSEPSTTQTLPLPVAAPWVVDYLDDYLLTADGWKFKCRRTVLVFQP